VTLELLTWLWSLPLDVTGTPRPAPVYPTQGQGFAAYLVGGFFGMGILMLAMFLLSLKPKRAEPPPATRND
jgi:hypothetical protein